MALVVIKSALGRAPSHGLRVRALVRGCMLRCHRLVEPWIMGRAHSVQLVVHRSAIIARIAKETLVNLRLRTHDHGWILR